MTVHSTRHYLGEYVRHRPLFLSVLRAKEAALYQPYLPLKHTSLDVGCGDGMFARITFGKNGVDVGLDMAESRIGEAGSNAAYKRLVTYDGRTIPFPARAFRTVVVNSVLEHVDDVDRVISEMYRVLAPNGICYATVMAAPWERYLFGAKLFGNAYRRWMRRKQVHRNLLTAKQWERAFVRAGFRMESVTPYGSPRASALLDLLHYVSAPSLVSYLLVRTWVPWPRMTRFLPLSWLSSFMDEPVSVSDASVLFFVMRHP